MPARWSPVPPDSRRSSAQTRERIGSVRRKHARAPGVRSPLRSPDPPLEPEDEAFHLRGARRHLHHRPPADAEAARGGARVRPQRCRARGDDPVRRHQEAVAGRGRGAGGARGNAVRQPPLARRPAHQLAHDLRADRASARAATPARRGPARAASAEGADGDAERAGEARHEPRRRRGHAHAARGGLRGRPAQGAARGARGAPPGPADHRARRHQLRPRRGRLRDPRQRRRDPLVRARRPGGGRRDRRREGEGRARGLRAQGRRGRGARGGGARSRGSAAARAPRPSPSPRPEPAPMAEAAVQEAE